MPLTAHSAVLSVWCVILVARAMGCGSSTNVSPAPPEAAVPYVVPGTKTTVPAAAAALPASVNVQSQQLCLSSWKRVLTGDTPYIKEKLSDKKSGAVSPTGLFYETFYRYLLVADPVSRDIFAVGGIQRRSRALLRLLSTALALTGDEAKEHALLSEIARKHAIEYGVAPDSYVQTLNSLISALRELLGEFYSDAVSAAWNGISQYMLKHMLPAARANYLPLVVIVGGGYAGVALAQALDASGLFRVLVIERKKYFFHNIGGMRAAVTSTFTDHVVLPYHGLLRRGWFVHGDVTRIEKDGVHMYGRPPDQPIRFKYLVIATGSSYAFPAKVAFTTRSELVASYVASAQRMTEASHIVIVGGGPVGCELAGELVDRFGTTKQITLVHPHPFLIFRKPNAPTANASVSGAAPPRECDLKTTACKRSVSDEEFGRAVEKQLTAMGVRVILNERMEFDAETTRLYRENRHHLIDRRHYPQALRTDRGTELKADLVMMCTGTEVNAASYAESFASSVGARQRLVVNSYLQVVDHGANTNSGAAAHAPPAPATALTNIFAIGDCALTPDPLMVMMAKKHAATAAANIIASERAQPLTPHVFESMSTILISLGSKHGVGMYEGQLLPEEKTVGIKSADLVSGMIFKEMGADIKQITAIKWPDSGEGGASPRTAAVDDTKVLAASMHISELEAAGLLTDGAKPLVRPNAATHT